MSSAAASANFPESATMCHAGASTSHCYSLVRSGADSGIASPLPTSSSLPQPSLELSPEAPSAMLSESDMSSDMLISYVQVVVVVVVVVIVVIVDRSRGRPYSPLA